MAILRRSCTSLVAESVIKTVTILSHGYDNSHKMTTMCCHIKFYYFIETTLVYKNFRVIERQYNDDNPTLLFWACHVMTIDR